MTKNTGAMIAAQDARFRHLPWKPDSSLSDFAADLRAPTPSAAAELLAPDAEGHALDWIAQTTHAQQAQVLRQSMQRCDRAFLRLQVLRPQAQLTALAQRAQQLQLRLQSAIARQLEVRAATLRHANAVLRAQHPQQRIDYLRERLWKIMRIRKQKSVKQTCFPWIILLIFFASYKRIN